jgi:tRNA A58 N-methylase Trm61
MLYSVHHNLTSMQALCIYSPCIEEVPQVHFSLQLKCKLEFFNWCQLEIKWGSAVENNASLIFNWD